MNNFIMQYCLKISTFLLFFLNKKLNFSKIKDKHIYQHLR